MNIEWFVLDLILLLQPIISIVAMEIHNRKFNKDHLVYKDALKNMNKSKDEYEKAKAQYETLITTRATVN